MDPDPQYGRQRGSESAGKMRIWMQQVKKIAENALTSAENKKEKRLKNLIFKICLIKSNTVL